MYIQNEKQRIVGNLDISGEWDKVYETSQMWTLVLIIPQIGALVTYEGKSYEVIQTTTHQEDSGIVTFCRILPISDEGDDISAPDNPPITVKADEITLI